MALRTFHSNPSLGGFGSESTSLLLAGSSRDAGPLRRVDGDAFGQIIKELVDNAVDACGTTRCRGAREDNAPKRVRVEIQRFTKPSNEKGGVVDNDFRNDDVLRVTVTDNGSGMVDIQTCVDPFHTSKAHATSKNRDAEGKCVAETETAGRYGIGLTLCLVHAQRLVPGSCASIRSARREDSHWSTMTCTIDTEGDIVHCIPGASIAKRFSMESGTSVSLLVPVSNSCQHNNTVRIHPTHTHIPDDI
jgi:DNA topoisomerase VI subunit B